MSTNLNDLISANSYESAFEICPGCENHCTVKLFHFQNGKTFFSGNNCEKVYSNTQQEQRRGTNMFAEKYRMLFYYVSRILGGLASIQSVGYALQRPDFPDLQVIHVKLGVTPAAAPKAGLVFYVSWHARLL